MQIDSASAMIDNDFLDHSVSMKASCEDVVRILSEIFLELGVDPMIHPLVMKHEVLNDSKRIKTVLSENIIKLPAFEDIHHNDTNRKAYYSFLVSELYKKFTGYSLDFGENDVFSFWKKGHSLGEIHSLSTCLLCGCGVFLSDDGDSQILRNIIKQTFAVDIAVHNRKAVINLISEKGTNLSRSDRRSFSHMR